VDGCELDDDDGSFGACGVITGGLDTELLETVGVRNLIINLFS